MGTRNESIKTQAELFMELRMLWIGLLYGDIVAQERIWVMMRDLCPPTRIDDEKIGDSGWVAFADGSEITWDWDNGDFAIGNLRYPYPWGDATTEPLFKFRALGVG